MPKLIKDIIKEKRYNTIEFTNDDKIIIHEWGSLLKSLVGIVGLSIPEAIGEIILVEYYKEKYKNENIDSDAVAVWLP